MGKILLACCFVFVGLAGAANIPPGPNEYLTPTNFKSTIEIIREKGYPIEEHVVSTADGYLLTMHRIPFGQETSSRSTRPVVFLQHGLLCSSADWVVSGPKKALAYILADAGYDVWMGNARGNTYSRKHSWLSPTTGAFWDFSWHEIGQHDLPAMIDFALQHTGEKSLHYIGHSQGTTSFFVMASVRPEYNAKIRSMHALAPVAFMSNLKSPFIRAVAPIVDQIETVLEWLGVHEFMPSTQMMENGGYFMCRDESVFQEVCSNVLFLIGGFNSEQLNRTILPSILENTPAGASVNQLVHYGQGVNSGKFRMYDFGRSQNIKKYGTATPPDYQLSKITAPVALHFGDNDWLAAVKDVDELSSKLPNLIGKFRVPHNKWNHLDFTWGIDADTLLFNRVLSLMDRY